MLNYSDRHWIEHPEHAIRSWSYKKKCQLLCVIDDWHSKHKAETTAVTVNEKPNLSLLALRCPTHRNKRSLLDNGKSPTMAMMPRH